MKILYPPYQAEKEDIIIFLAGPIQGARDWQSDAYEKILELAIENNLEDRIIVANPRRIYMDDEFVYEKQVDWETEYLNKASKKGVILFWLEKEQIHYCNRPFAQTTRFELAEWKVKHQLASAKIVVGIDEEFTNKRYISRRFKQDCSDIKINNSLANTCKDAIRVIIENYQING